MKYPQPEDYPRLALRRLERTGNMDLAEILGLDEPQELRPAWTGKPPSVAHAIIAEIGRRVARGDEEGDIVAAYHRRVSRRIVYTVIRAWQAVL